MIADASNFFATLLSIVDILDSKVLNLVVVFASRVDTELTTSLILPVTDVLLLVTVLVKVSILLLNAVSALVSVLLNVVILALVSLLAAI